MIKILLIEDDRWLADSYMDVLDEYEVDTALDAQTAMGKVAGGISQLAKASHTPVIAICGSVDELKPAQTSQFYVIMPSIQKLDSIDNVFKSAYKNIEITATNIAAAIKLGQSIREK